MDYTRETDIPFTITSVPSTAAWQFASTPEETSVQYRDECNEYIDNISIILRKLDCGVTVSDLGFLFYK